MKDSNKRFAVIILLLCVLACSLIASYFYYMAHSSTPDNLARLQAMLNAKTDDLNPAAQNTSPTAEETKPQAGNTAGKPDDNTAKVKFDSKLTGLTAGEAEDATHKADDQYVLPPPRLAPDMFTFSSLPNNAPVAEFPLVLVGQKSLEWYRTRSGNDGGGAIGAPGAELASIHGRPPGPPPGPPTPPGPPPEPPEPPKPPPPPPEVSPSGL